MKCYKCASEIPLEGAIGRQDTCPQCGSYLHCCLNCRFYDPVAHHECREPQAEWVRDKEMGNFCDYFEPATVDRSVTSKAVEARKKLDGLFGN